MNKNFIKFSLSTQTRSTVKLSQAKSLQYLITQLANTSNLFLGISFPFFLLILFLQLQTRYLNFLYLKHSLLSLSSSSAFNLTRAYCWLSILLIKELYCLRNIMLCPSRSNKVLISLITTTSIREQDLHPTKYLLLY